jgi:hypothetical protein
MAVHNRHCFFRRSVAIVNGIKDNSNGTFQRIVALFRPVDYIVVALRDILGIRGRA